MKCCGSAGSRHRWAAWVAPAAVLVLMPKCPMCVAAYALAVTGVSMSAAMAGWVRTGLIGASVAALAWLSVGSVRAYWRRRADRATPRDARSPAGGADACPAGRGY
ncbi:MAG: hypothetical protein ACAI43_14365 [Phycisphaerae bacterium]|nr:hypothetical protein [Tepidisphaeraceae bacterium]